MASIVDRYGAQIPSGKLGDTIDDEPIDVYVYRFIWFLSSRGLSNKEIGKIFNRSRQWADDKLRRPYGEQSLD